jgi:glycosyltransferase involved in cell wall biosynthesis
MNIGGLCPSTEIWGGVRRYFELGNALVGLGHEYTFCYNQITRKPWVEFKGNLCRTFEIKDTEFDILFTGAKESFKDLLKMKAKVKIVFVVSNYYTDAYIDLWRNGGDKFLWIGVSHGWQNQFSNIGIDGFTCPGGVNTDFFYPDYSKRPKDILRCCFYGKKYCKDVLDYDHLFSEISAFIKRNGMNKIEFVGFDSAQLYYPGIKTQINNNQEELRDLYQASHINISVKKRGRWNNTVVESLACGTPVICYPEETVDFMDDYVTGRLLYNNFSISSALEWFLENKDYINSYGSFGRKNAEKVSWNKHAQHVLEVVEKWKRNSL